MCSDRCTSVLKESVFGRKKNLFYIRKKRKEKDGRLMLRSKGDTYAL